MQFLNCYTKLFPRQLVMHFSAWSNLFVKLILGYIKMQNFEKSCSNWNGTVLNDRWGSWSGWHNYYWIIQNMCMCSVHIKRAHNWRDLKIKLYIEHVTRINGLKSEIYKTRKFNYFTIGRFATLHLNTRFILSVQNFKSVPHLRILIK